MSKRKGGLIEPNGNAVPEHMTWQNKLRGAIFSGVSESDVKEIVANLVKRAKEGDPKAIKMFFEYIAGGKGPSVAVQYNHYGSQPEPKEPSRTKAGTPERLEDYGRRARNGQALFSKDDGA